MKTEHITIRVESDDYVLLKAFATAKHLTVSNVLRCLIKAIAERMKDSVPAPDVLLAPFDDDVTTQQ